MPRNMNWRNPSSLSDLAKDRLNHRFAQPVPAAPTGPRQLGTHRRYLGDAASAGGTGFMMTPAPGGNLAIHMMPSEDGEIALKWEWAFARAPPDDPHNQQRGEIVRDVFPPGSANRILADSVGLILPRIEGCLSIRIGWTLL
jgi:hypothetical protein